MANASFGKRLPVAALALLLPTAAAVSQTAATDAPTAQAAQGAAAAAVPPSATAAQPAEAQDQEIVVTGSRIARPEFAAPNPITSFNAAAIQQSGNTNVTTFLERVPALTNSLDSSRTAGNTRPDGQFGEAGLNLLDLRGLGPARTLVLVNGRRHVAGQVNTAAVDINSIPTDLIERVDVLTGGASAVYGADGVSGVVNFILKRDFDGISGRTQFGISSRGDAANRFASVQAGRNFADGRGNVTLSYEYNSDDPLANDDRRYLQPLRRGFFVNADDYDPTKPGSYQLNFVRALRYPFSSTYGIVSIGDTLFRGDGALYTPGRQLVNDSYTVGGDDTPVAGYVGDILPKVRRHAANLLSHFDFSDAFKLSVEGKFVQTKTRTFSGYGGDYPATFTLDNPFIPPSILAAAQAAGLTSIDLNRNNFDIGRRGEADRRRTYRGVVDVSGRITDHARYDAYYTYGATDVRITHLNDRLNDRFTAALDVVTDPATGQPTCRSNLDPTALQVPATTFTPGPNSGCVPVNLFGDNTVSPLSYGFFTYDNDSSARVTQQVANASVSGDFGQFFALPGGPVEFAFGGEYRRETSRFRPNGALTANQFYQYDEYIIPTASSGRFNVKEAFGELNAPILKDRPFAYILSAGAAGRYSHYSTIGSTRAYQFNGVYAPVRDISFRGSYGRSVRAPNVGEIFQPQTGTSAFFDDPCYVANRSAGTQYRAANCQALIQQSGGNVAAFTAANNPDSFVFIPGLQQGNASLKAETARTWTAGVVLRPRFVRGLTVSVDWYDIRLRDAINTPGANTIAELCVDQPTLDNVFCRSIDRQQGTGFISGFLVQPQNVAAFRTSGLDLNADYQVRTARFGSFDLRFVGGYLHRLSQIATPGAVVENNVDQPYRPKYNFVLSPTWTLGGVTVSYNLRWQDGVRRIARVTTDDNPSYIDSRYFRLKALWEHDLQVQYLWRNGWSAYAGVNNLTDEKPDVLGPSIDTDRPISPLGRYFYAGVRVNLSRR